MKLFKMIEILKDKENWKYDKNSIRKTHVPTGIHCYSGANFWDKNDKLVYDVGFLSFTILDFYIKALERHLDIKEDSFDEIYYNWIDSREDI
jgi:hypothetical protein